jgi:pyruvate,water dikinase
MEWEFDGLASTTFPLYSRAVVGDLCPEPVTPLTASLGVGAELGPAWSRVYADLGLRPDPYPDPYSEPEPGPSGHAVAMFGAQLYLNTSLLRLFGASASGADPVTWVRQYLGDRPEVPRQRTEQDTPAATPSQLSRWTDEVLNGQPDRAERGRLARRVGQLRAGRPELGGCSAPELAARITAARGELRWGLRLHARAELATALVTELLTRTAEDAGRPSRTGDLVAGLGGAAGAEPMTSLWRLGRQVRASDRLQRLFDQGVPHAAGQLVNAGNNEVGRLRTAVGPLLAEHGHHGPGGWELGGAVWVSEPRLLLSLLNALRHCTDDQEPAARARGLGNTTATATAAVRAALSRSPVASARFEAALSAVPRWLAARRRLVDLVSVVAHEQRLAALELGRRQVEKGLLDGVDQVFMLLAAELEEFTREPERLAEPLRMRAYDYYALGTFRPPFVTVGQPPPAVRWPRAAGRGTRIGVSRRGLIGTGVAPGSVTGPVRMLRSTGTSNGPRPGDVLVVPSAGVDWLPLLAGAAAVVVDAGGPLSEVAVACRDLGIPCVVGCVDATDRLEPGQEMVVDGWLGTVRPERTAVAEQGQPAVAEPVGEPSDAGLT